MLHVCIDWTKQDVHVFNHSSMCQSINCYNYYFIIIIINIYHSTVCVGLNLSDYAELYEKAFGAGSPYDIPKNVKPVQGPWQGGGMKR